MDGHAGRMCRREQRPAGRETRQSTLQGQRLYRRSYRQFSVVNTPYKIDTAYRDAVVLFSHHCTLLHVRGDGVTQLPSSPPLSSPSSPDIWAALRFRGRPLCVFLQKKRE